MAEVNLFYNWALLVQSILSNWLLKKGSIFGIATCIKSQDNFTIINQSLKLSARYFTVI